MNEVIDLTAINHCGPILVRAVSPHQRYFACFFRDFWKWRNHLIQRNRRLDFIAPAVPAVTLATGEEFEIWAGRLFFDEFV